MEASSALRRDSQESSVVGELNYLAEMDCKPRYYANDQTRNVLRLDPRSVSIFNGRMDGQRPSLEREGIQLVRWPTKVSDFRDADQVANIYPGEVAELIRSLTGGDEVLVMGPAGLRFGEKSPDSGRLMNSHPARFIHNDVSTHSAPNVAAYPLGDELGPLDRYRRYAIFNVWRTFSGPPQDIPLAVCDATTVADADLVPADAIFDAPGQPEVGFEGFLLRYNPKHKWVYFPDMTVDEAIVFKTFDSELGQPRLCPHSAFDDPTCPAESGPRESAEMRIAVFFRA